MTRGQESLMMELEAPAAAAAAAAGLHPRRLQADRAGRRRRKSSLSHEQYLDAMEKESKGPSLWRKLVASS